MDPRRGTHVESSGAGGCVLRPASYPLQAALEAPGRVALPQPPSRPLPRRATPPSFGTARLLSATNSEKRNVGGAGSRMGGSSSSLIGPPSLPSETRGGEGCGCVALGSILFRKWKLPEQVPKRQPGVWKGGALRGPDARLFRNGAHSGRSIPLVPGREKEPPRPRRDALPPLACPTGGPMGRGPPAWPHLVCPHLVHQAGSRVRGKGCGRGSSHSGPAMLISHVTSLPSGLPSPFLSPYMGSDVAGIHCLPINT